MAEVSRTYRVDIMEYERGWGAKVDGSKYFDSKKSALDFVESFNSKNTSPTAPDWYMVAEYRG